MRRLFAVWEIEERRRIHGSPQAEKNPQKQKDKIMQNNEKTSNPAIANIYLDS